LDLACFMMDDTAKTFFSNLGKQVPTRCNHAKLLINQSGASAYYALFVNR
jgi:hypothetical protein